MATGQSGLGSLSMVICAFQVTLDHAKLTILTNQDTPNSIYGELVNNRSVTNIIIFMFLVEFTTAIFGSRLLIEGNYSTIFAVTNFSKQYF